MFDTNQYFEVYFGTDNYTHDMCVASVGCFPGAWRRGSSHFQVASLHLQSRMDILFVRFTLFFLPEQAKRAAYAARGAKRLVYTVV